ncbi:hypothetical protein B9Z55_020599 [Caenorhabditis nigoni]|uniref:Uncharacterized protein n=1 Tax=Caenorhabditis nigoni TaxID=1611254 RepID=A0A2G5TNI2_9PELO|nr:hypothetical protein B9Z55_020599 [Caenorhabditis nigoni]
MENALTLSQDLGKGVHLLQKMAVLHYNKGIVLEVSKSGNDVLDELKKLINTLDTSLFKAELEKTVKQLDNLESFSKTHLDGDLQRIGTIFDEASSISGVSIDSKLLADPVSVSFATSSNQNIQKSAGKFKKLGNLQLDFSNHRADFKTASLSVIKLKRFFDDLFVISTVSTSEHHTDYSILQYSAFLLIFIPVGLAYYGTRVILKNRKLDDPNTYLHLLHTPEGQMQNVGRDYWNYYNPPLPIHTALKQQNWKKFKEEVDRGANVNAYFNEGFSLTTPVLYAQDVPKYAIYLIKNGADTSLLSSDFSKFSWDGPYKKYKNKKYRRRMPPLFKPTDFVVFPGVKWTMKENFPGEFKFREEFSANVVENWSGATHIVIPVDKDGSVIFTDEHWKENPNRAFMSSFFDGTMMLKPEWIIASLNDQKNFAKDYKYQVQSVKIREKKYDTVLKIYQHVHERRLPFLYKIRAYFYGRDEDYWYHLARIVNLLGGQSLAHGHLPSKGVFRNFDGHLDCQARPFSFYRDDIGPMFILIDDPEVVSFFFHFLYGFQKTLFELREKHPHLFNNNWITFMDFYTFLEFVFKFEIRHWKLPGGKKQKDSLAPEDMLALDLGIDWAGENPRDLAREPKWDC